MLGVFRFIWLINNTRFHVEDKSKWNVSHWEERYVVSNLNKKGWALLKSKISNDDFSFVKLCLATIQLPSSLPSLLLFLFFPWFVMKVPFLPHHISHFWDGVSWVPPPFSIHAPVPPPHTHTHRRSRIGGGWSILFLGVGRKCFKLFT